MTQTNATRFSTSTLTSAAVSATRRSRGRLPAHWGWAFAFLALGGCSGAESEHDAALWLGEHEAALNKGGGGVTEEECTSAWQNCYLECTVDRYPESNDSPNNLNDLFREGCLDSCDAAHRGCSDVATLSNVGEVVGGLTVFEEPRVVRPVFDGALRPLTPLAPRASRVASP